MNQSGRGNQQPGLSVPYSTNQRQSEHSKTFFGQVNYARILQPLREQYERKMNTDELPEEADRRLQKTLQHYMSEVFRLNGSNTTVNSLNQEVFRETSLNFDGWLQKQVSTNTTNSRTRGSAIANDNLFENIGNRFDREQQLRAPPPAQPMASVDFTLPKNDDDDDNEDPLDKFERLRKIREAEAKTTAQPKKPSSNNDQYSEPSAPAAVSSLPPVQQNNPAPPPLLAPRPQEYIIKQEEVVKYKENEVNLFINSGDRDWILNRNENRYNFTINFNTVSSNNNSTFSPSVKERFRNIVRMELVKIIISAESLDMSYRMIAGSPTPVLDTSRVISVLSYPYIMVRISEWSSNGFGTNANIDNTFGLVQYDQSWKSDNAAGNFGYISMTPRYLKAQRIYQPTPLATLQKLSIQIERPDGNPLTQMLDTLDLLGIYLSDSTTGSNYSTTGLSNNYIFIKTQTYFSRFFVGEGDRIQIRSYSTTVKNAAQVDFDNFINNESGHIVVGIGNSTTLSVTDNFNTSGYANIIIIRSRFGDPTTGNFARSYFSGSQPLEEVLMTNLVSQPAISGSALLNTNRQSHFVLRLITREMDGSSNLRPDNS
jgi:hypothetical protein